MQREDPAFLTYEEAQQALAMMDKWRELRSAMDRGRKQAETLEKEVRELRGRAEQQNGTEEKAEEGGEDHRQVVVEKPRRTARRGRGVRGGAKGRVIATRKARGARKFRGINFEIGCQECNILWHPSLEECELGGCHFCSEGKGGVDATPGRGRSTSRRS
mmetsp:Transcript_44896/g.70239  ORF Transcript_44896/g.70239 Transcript_44896/m.70239 type:complete len:160 (-) Transcript_44896:72-551(-)